MEDREPGTRNKPFGHVCRLKKRTGFVHRWRRDLPVAGESWEGSMNEGMPTGAGSQAAWPGPSPACFIPGAAARAPGCVETSQSTQER